MTTVLTAPVKCQPPSTFPRARPPGLTMLVLSLGQALGRPTFGTADSRPPERLRQAPTITKHAVNRFRTSPAGT
jgi:hypothetical protein